MQNYKSCAKRSASKEKVETGEKKEKVTTVCCPALRNYR